VAVMTTIATAHKKKRTDGRFSAAKRVNGRRIWGYGRTPEEAAKNLQEKLGLGFIGMKMPEYDFGDVYFVQPEGQPDANIKIGFTTQSVAGRLGNLQCGSHERLSVLHHLPAQRRHEADLHERFKHLRVTGEWFRPEPELLRFIEVMKQL
jgi:hypothetical protein